MPAKPPSGVGTSAALGPHASRRPISFAGASDAARVDMNAKYPTPGDYRQLNQRTADGLAVTLEWNPTTEALRIVVVDHASDPVTFPVRAEDASDAFVHPFIYAGGAVRR